MPTAPQTFRPRGRAAAVAEPRIDRRGSAGERGYGHDWTEFRAAAAARHPTCDLCWSIDRRATPTHEIDHVIPIVGPSDPLRLDPANVRGLCRRCHAVKTKRLDRRIRAYFERLLRDRLPVDKARDHTLYAFRRRRSGRPDETAGRTGAEGGAQGRRRGPGGSDFGADGAPNHTP